jgi:lysophospholipase L1-like esterase
LNSLGIRHTFFNAFYESSDVVLDREKHQLLDAEEFDKVIENFKISITDYNVRHLGLVHLLGKYQEIYKNNYVKKTFVGHLKEQMKEHGLHYDDVFDVFHPSELGHEKWANYLYTVLFK